MESTRMIVRLTEDPRAVELEITAPLGAKAIGPFDETLAVAGARALGTITFTTVSHVVLRAKLVELNGSALSSSRVGAVLESLRRRLYWHPASAEVSRAA